MIRRFLTPFLASAKGDEIPVVLRINGKLFRVRFGNSSPTEFWSIRSVLIEVLVKETYKIELADSSVRTIIDAGANVGISTLYFASLYPNAMIYCYEPSKESYNLLLKNLRQNNVNFQAVRKALYEREGDAYFDDDGPSSMERSLVPSGMTSCNFSGEKVETVTLAWEIERLGLDSVDLVKFDIEGAEASMLRGLGAAMNVVRVFIGEVHDDRLRKEIQGTFLENGYTVKWQQGHIVATQKITAANPQ